MTAYVLPAAVARFLHDYIRSVDDLHLLVAVASHAERWWDADSVANDLLIDTRDARGLLEHLAAQNLMEIRITGDVRYQFRPGTQALNDVAQACLSAYREHPVAVLRAVAGSGGRRGIRDFADAFRLRRDGDR